MNINEQTQLLAQAIRESDDYLTCAQNKKAAMENETTAALVKEYKKLQMALQIGALSGTQMPQEDVQRFSAIGSLLFSSPEASAYLLAEMRLQQTLSDIVRQLTEAVGLELPGMQ